MSVTSWFLVSSSGTRHRLPREMIFVGRDDCELMLQSRSVDKQHAVINYDPATDEHLVKDLGSLNGTFVNDLRIPDQTYITLKLSDIIRFGYDAHVYILERSQHKVPEEALKHEKYTSQLQIGVKTSESKRREHAEEKSRATVSPSSKQDKSDRKATPDAPVSRPTPLYGQPSWWGDDDEEHLDQCGKADSKEPGVNGCHGDDPSKPVYSYRREPSYFEIPTKEIQQPAGRPKTSEPPQPLQLQEIPTKDTDAQVPSLPIPIPATQPETPPVVQSHASFTIEFDDCEPGKIMIKDHVTKFSFRQRRRESGGGGEPAASAAATPLEEMSAESKVADWLVQSDVGMMRRKSRTDDLYSTKSDLPINNKTLNDHQHEDGTQSDSEDPVLKEKQRLHSQSPASTQRSPQPRQHSPSDLSTARSFTPPSIEPPLTSSTPALSSPPQSQARGDPQQAFVIEFFDDSNARKKRSHSFSNNMGPGEANVVLKSRLEKRKSAALLGERGTAAQGSTLPTQQFTVPLKGSSSSGGFYRAGSLRREKTDVRLGSSSNFSSRSASSRPFGSVGRRSKLAQDFANEFLRQSRPPSATAAPAPSSSSSSSSPSASTATSAASTQAPLQRSTPASCPSHHSSGPKQSSVPMKGPLMSLKGSDPDPKAPRAFRNEEEDSLSDAGTYTIEGDIQDKEVEEARNRIDKVFGVVESPDSSTQPSPEAFRPELLGRRRSSREAQSSSLSHSEGSSSAPAQGNYSAGFSQSQSQSESSGGPRWVSRWASLADSYSDSNPVTGLFDIPAQMDLSSSGGARIIHQAMLNKSFEPSESEGTRSRRVLPQVPSQEKAEASPPSIHIQPDPYGTYDVKGRRSKSPRQKEDVQRLHVQDDLDPDSLSDASKSDDSSVVEQGRRSSLGRSGGKSWSRNRTDTLDVSAKSTSYCVSSEDSLTKPEWDQDERPKFSSATMTRHRPTSATGSTTSPPNLDGQERAGSASRSEGGTSPSFSRQESYTKSQAGDDGQQKRLPNISNSQDFSKDRSASAGIGTQDTHSYLKQTEDVLAALEAKLQVQSYGQSLPASASAGVEDSLSGESDVDTSSTVSQLSSKNSRESVSGTGKKSSSSTATGSVHKTRSSVNLMDQDGSRPSPARTRLYEKRQVSTADSLSSSGRPRTSLRQSVSKHGSMDFSEDNLLSGCVGVGTRHWSDSMTSDQESGSRTSFMRKKSAAPLQREEPTKTSRTGGGGAVAQALGRSNSLSAPRPTRASMLRRARLGDASDNEGPETERTWQSANESGVPVGTRAPPQEVKQQQRPLSRLDLLALPRKRTSSFTTPSDTEASAPPRTGFSNRSSESTTSVRKASVAADPKSVARKAAVQAAHKPIIRGRSSSAKYASSTASSRRRQKGSDYTSTSEEEYDSNHSTPKHKRSHHTSGSSASGTPRGQTPVLARAGLRVRSRESGEESHGEGDAFQNWSSHSAEIARLSQDLAKDLAILAREIHDVAGDATEQPQADAAEPISTVPVREELRHNIPEASLNFQKSQSASGLARHPDQVLYSQEMTSKHRGRAQDEVAGENLLLNPVSQVSLAIRENTEQLTEKLKVLFQNKADVWEEIEAINSDNDIPTHKTGNKEISAILKELRRVQRQLEVINNIIEPDGKAELSRVSSSSTPSLMGLRGDRPLLRDRRPTTSPRASGAGAGGGGGGGGPPPARPGSRKSGAASDGESFVV
ncbi:centrosomal protein of 170 kDa protein B isoform X2 [Alosa alosa]|uniref:centrosomal protein of 170 kDa protein B isoform X2 n=1 Tax=Alosa alosa TaxID=278164 RepID=UPI00201534BA|nr:centrosomal protein of 170 kDa protein B isoform X2 [Alosa alosa]